jgi:hypothetical protein
MIVYRCEGPALEAAGEECPMTRNTAISILLAAITAGVTAQCGNVPALYNGGTYCTSGGGPMFDVVALNPFGVRITGFDVNLNAGTHSISVYAITAGTSFIGNELVLGAWTLLGTATTVSTGNSVPTSVPVSCNVFVPPGATMGFHVRAGAGGLLYTSGGVLGGVLAATADLQVLVGKTQCDLGGGPFTGSVPSPRQFNGTVHYNADFQINRPAASASIDGIQGTYCVPAIVMKAQGAPGVLSLGSTNVGSAFEVLISLAPLIPASGGAFVTANGQILNANLAAGSIAFLNGGPLPVFTPLPGPLSITFLAPLLSLTASVQMAVLDPSHPDGFVLSQGIQLVVL